MDLLVSFSMLRFLIIIVMILRAKLKFLQKIFLTALVIGGFIGLILGPIVLRNHAILPLPKEWINTYALLPGILIVPVVAAVPLGMKFKSWKRKKGATINKNNSKPSSHVLRNIAVMTGVLFFIIQEQKFFVLFIIC